MSELDKCPHCGADLRPKAARVAIHGMYDCHLFKRYKGSTVDDIVDQWIRSLPGPHTGIGLDGKPVDIGPDSLCPANVLDEYDKILRSVGPMLHVDYKTRGPKDLSAVERYKVELMNDPDIPRLLRAGKY